MSDFFGLVQLVYIDQWYVKHEFSLHLSFNRIASGCAEMNMFGGELLAFANLF
jgi:hypothetical protein